MLIEIHCTQCTYFNPSFISKCPLKTMDVDELVQFGNTEVNDFDLVFTFQTRFFFSNDEIIDMRHHLDAGNIRIKKSHTQEKNQ